MTELAELLRRAMEHRLADVRTAMPVRVKSYDVATQTVDVIPLVREITETDDDDIEEALPVIPSVPVGFLRAGGFFFSLPIEAGDTGQIIICDRSIDQWRARGSDSFTPDHGFSIHPLDKRRHGLSGAVFYPGLSDSLNPLSDAHASNLVLGKDGGHQIHVKDAAISLGEENPVQKLLLGTIYRTAQTTLNSALQTGWGALFTGFTAMATGWTAAGVAFNALSALPGMAVPMATAVTACGAASTASTAAATASTAVANAIGAFKTTAAANQDFQSNTVKTAL